MKKNVHVDAAERQRRRRRAFADAGMCVNSRKDRPHPNDRPEAGLKCSACRARERESYDPVDNKRRCRARREGLLAQVRCPGCSRRREQQEKALCNECLEKRRVEQSARSSERKRRGVCVRCEEPIEPGNDTGKCQRHRLEARATTTTWRQALRDEGLCDCCGEEPPREGAHDCYLCAHQESKTSRERNRKVKTEAFLTYGDGRCQCCGEDTLEFLTLDHIDGDRRAEEKTGIPWYWELKKRGWPDRERLRVLCFKCNFTSTRGNPCRHERIPLLEELEELEARRDELRDLGLSRTDEGRACQSRIEIIRLKKEVITEYGGACHCCGEAELDFLTVDHLRNDGKRQREDETKYYRKLKGEGFPKDKGLAAACFNCNSGRATTVERTCPHRGSPSARS